MTKQEEIREGIAEIIAHEHGFEWEDLPKDSVHRAFYLAVASVVIKYENSQGVVIKVDKEATSNLINDLWDAVVGTELVECRLLAKKALNKAGWVATKPLIEEGK